LFWLESVVGAIDAVRPKDFYFKGESHDFWEIVYILDGKAIATADDHVYSLSKGQMIFHKPMEFHRIWSSEGTSPHLLIISFSVGGKGMKNFENKLYNIDKTQEEDFKDIVVNLANVLKIAKSQGTGSDFYKYLSSTVSVDIERFLLQLLNNEVPTHPTRIIGTGEIYEQIVRILNQHCCEDLNVTQIASLCNMSVSSLKKVFHQFSDKGIIKYFNSIKMRKAMSWLNEGVPISQISERLSFSSTNYFHVVFKRETGYTPRDYQKSHKKQLIIKKKTVTRR